MDLRKKLKPPVQNNSKLKIIKYPEAINKIEVSKFFEWFDSKISKEFNNLSVKEVLKMLDFGNKEKYLKKELETTLNIARVDKATKEYFLNTDLNNAQEPQVFNYEKEILKTYFRMYKFSIIENDPELMHSEVMRFISEKTIEKLKKMPVKRPIL